MKNHRRPCQGGRHRQGTARILHPPQEHNHDDPPPHCGLLRLRARAATARLRRAAGGCRQRRRARRSRWCCPAAARAALPTSACCACCASCGAGRHGGRHQHGQRGRRRLCGRGLSRRTGFAWRASTDWDRVVADRPRAKTWSSAAARKTCCCRRASSSAWAATAFRCRHRRPATRRWKRRWAACCRPAPATSRSASCPALPLGRLGPGHRRTGGPGRHPAVPDHARLAGGAGRVRAGAGQRRLVVDGGLVRNLPIDLAHKMGADIVIAVNVGTPLVDRTGTGQRAGRRPADDQHPHRTERAALDQGAASERHPDRAGARRRHLHGLSQRGRRDQGRRRGGAQAKRTCWPRWRWARTTMPCSRIGAWPRRRWPTSRCRWPRSRCRPAARSTRSSWPTRPAWLKASRPPRTKCAGPPSCCTGAATWRGSRPTLRTNRASARSASAPPKRRGPAAACGSAWSWPATSTTPTCSRSS
jgi:hypothetical protein